MKNIILFFFFLVACMVIKAQSDIIYKIDRSEIKCKVVEITEQNTVKYKEADNLDGPMLNIKADKVFMIQYANGKIWKPEIEQNILYNNSTINSTKEIDPVSPNYVTVDGIKAVIIGTQTWMVENLKVDYFRNGDPIPQIKSAKVWPKTPACCSYQYNSDNDAVYGKYYNYECIDDPRGIAPYGWHVATFDDWFILSKFLGGYNKCGWALKTASELWTEANYNTNSSGFSAIPAGFAVHEGGFSEVGISAQFWSVNHDKKFRFSDDGKYQHCSTAFGLYSPNKELFSIGAGGGVCFSGYSVRCVKD